LKSVQKIIKHDFSGAGEAAGGCESRNAAADESSIAGGWCYLRHWLH
jgi:hypothetical protein